MDVVEEAKRVKGKFIKLENEEKEKLKRIEEWKETVEKERRKIEIEKRKQEILGKLMDDKRVTAYLTKKLKELSKRVKELSKEYIETNERLKEIREKSRKEQLRTRQKLIKKLNKEIKDFRERLYNLRRLENIKKEHIKTIDMKIQALQEYPKEGKNSRIYKKRTGKDIKEEVEANCNIDQEIKELERINARILKAKNDLKILNESKGIEDIEEETTITIISRIYEDAMGQYETIKWIDEMTGERHIETLHDHNIKKRINTIKDRIKTVVKEGKLPYIDYNERTGEYVINSTFTTRLKKADGIDISLKSMGHLMQDFGWRHTKRKKLGRQFKAVVFKADKMLDMIEYLKGITISDD